MLAKGVWIIEIGLYCIPLAIRMVTRPLFPPFPSDLRDLACETTLLGDGRHLEVIGILAKPSFFFTNAVCLAHKGPSKW